MKPYGVKLQDRCIMNCCGKYVDQKYGRRRIGKYNADRRRKRAARQQGKRESLDYTLETSTATGSFGTLTEC